MSHRRDDDARAAVETACRAPSVHNTQPWRWRINGSTIELHSDRDRQLTASDPEGRNLLISCGAALHHLQVAAANLGRELETSRRPDAADPDLVAVAELGRRVPVAPADAELLRALLHRTTDRRRFTTWPVPDQRLEKLAEVAQGWGTRIAVLTAPSSRATVERLVERAIEIQRDDPAARAEQERWVRRSRPFDGVPASAVPPQDHASEVPDRFDRATTAHDPRQSVVPGDGVLAICTARDDAAAWLDTGETLSALWLRATIAGMSIVPLSQVIEVEQTRLSLRHRVFLDGAHPQLLVRVGWQAATRPALPPVPRRPLADVLDRD